MKKFEQYNEDLAKAYGTMPKSIVNALIEKDAINMYGKDWHQMYQYSTSNDSIIYGLFEDAIYDLSKTVKKNILKKEFDWIYYKQAKEFYSNDGGKEFLEQEMKKEYVQLILNPVYQD